MGLAWALSANNELQNINRLSPNQLAFGCNPNFQSVPTDSLPVLERKACSQIIADNLTAIHAACKAFLETEASEKIQRALRLKIRTSGDLTNFAEDLAYVKRNNCD